MILTNIVATNYIVPWYKGRISVDYKSFLITSAQVQLQVTLI